MYHFHHVIWQLFDQYFDNLLLVHEICGEYYILYLLALLDM